MSGLFSAAARAPLTSFLFAFELTGDYRALLPLMIGCMCADIVARSLSRESVMTERLARRGLRVNQGYEARLLTVVSVGEVMTRAIDALGATMTVREAAAAVLGQPIALPRQEAGHSMPAIARTEVGTANDSQAPYLVRVGHGPGQAIRSSEVCGNKVERCGNSSFFDEFVEKCCHVLQRAGEICRGMRTTEPRQIRRETPVLILHLFDHAAPHLC